MNAYKRAWTLGEVIKQKAWIESCESNGKSYTGLNGPAIRQADNDQLISLEKELRS